MRTMKLTTQVAKAARTLGIKVRSATLEDDIVCLFAKDIRKHLQFLLDSNIYYPGSDFCNGSNEIYLTHPSCLELIKLAEKKEANQRLL